MRISYWSSAVCSSYLCVVEGGIELVDGVRPEGVAHLGPVERDPHHSQVGGAVIRDVGEREAGDFLPHARVEDLGHQRCTLPAAISTAERRVGTECVRTCRARVSAVT